MTHFNLNELSIKTEPLSPITAEQLMAHITPSPIHHNALSPAPGIGMAGPSIGPATPSTDTRNALKSSILSKRKLRGETTLPLTNDGPREYKLTKREIERKEARKEQNRRAARKCRIKKKSVQESAEQEMASARKENVHMRRVVLTLRQQVAHLQNIISDHERSQHCKLTPSNSTCNSSLQSNTPAPDPRLCLPGPMAPIGVNSDCAPFHHFSPSQSNPPQIVLSNTPDIPSQKHPLSILLPDSDSHSFLTEFTNDDNMHSDPDSVHSNLPSWDLKNLNSDFKLDQEVPVALFESLLGGDYEMEEFETPKAVGEVKINEKLLFSYPANTETPKTFMSNKTTNSKPPVVRNLNRYFTQTSPDTSFLKPHQQHLQHTRKNAPPPLKLNKQNTNDFLLDPNLSSPILKCVSPNLVQQPMLSTSKPVLAGNVQTSIQSSNTRALSSFTPFENQVIAQNSHSLLRIEPRDSNESGLFESMSNSLELQVEDNQQNDIIFDAYYNMCESNSFPIPTHETALTSYCSSNNNHMSNGDMFSPPGSNNSPGFTYQLSPISVSSPSNASNVSSPGFLQSPHNELCNSNVFEFNV